MLQHRRVRGLCPICADDRRDQTTICVVENPPDVVAVERSGAFHGTYHVLHGVLNPLEGVTPDRLRIQELIAGSTARSRRSSCASTPTSRVTRPRCT